MTVLMKNCPAASARDGRDFLNQQLWIGNEAKHPAAPAEIKRTVRQIVIHQVELVNIDLGKRLGLDGALDRVYKITRPFDCDYPSAGSDNFSEIDRRIARSGGDIEDATSIGNGRRFPAIQNDRAPGAMLYSQSRQCLLVCAEDVIALF